MGRQLTCEFQDETRLGAVWAGQYLPAKSAHRAFFAHSDQGDDFFYRSNVVSNVRLQRRCDAQALVNPAEGVVHAVKRDGVGKIFDLVHGTNMLERSSKVSKKLHLEV